MPSSSNGAPHPSPLPKCSDSFFDSVACRCLIFDLEDDGTLSDECHELCQRFVAADLVLDVGVSTNGTEVIVQVSLPGHPCLHSISFHFMCNDQVGAPFEILVDEANSLKPRMRLRDTLGYHEFVSSSAGCIWASALPSKVCALMCQTIIADVGALGVFLAESLRRRRLRVQVCVQFGNETAFGMESVGEGCPCRFGTAPIHA
eukprot:SAG31_NODE_4141_length_3539_cov_2.949419_1_plen_203_part_00